jgi:hypothetical protein
MKKIVLILFIILSTFIVTGCDMDVDSLKDKYKEVQNDDDGCKGWKENGKCCTAEYSGQNVDADEKCPGAQKPGKEIGHGTNQKGCYISSCQ